MAPVVDPVAWAFLLPKINIQDFSVVFVTKCFFFTKIYKIPQIPQFTGTIDENLWAEAQQSTGWGDGVMG
ncbi:MAG: hypothetical protein Fur0025_42290 [Oscillatoriaceae cyanobacterium]